MESDQNIVLQASAGCRDAFDELVRRYRRRVYNLVRALTAGDTEAEDLVQDVFIRAYRAIGGFRGDSAFGSWLYRIAVNVVHTHLDRRRTRDAAVPSARSDSPAVDDVADHHDIEQTLARRQAIDRALASLPEELRVLVVLRDVQGMKYEEIARIVKIPRGTVESRLFRARQRLRPMLETYRSRGPAADACVVGVASSEEKVCSGKGNS